MSLSISFQKLQDTTTETQITATDVDENAQGRLDINASFFTVDLRILVLFQSTLNRLTNAISGIRTRLDALGYVENLDYTITGKNLTDSYSGATDLDSPYPYNVVFITTDGGGRGTNAMGTRLNSYLAAGNHMVMGTFCWNLYISQSSFLYFDYGTYSPLVVSGTQSSFATNTNITEEETHPITTGVTLTITGSARFYNNGVTLKSGATTISKYAPNNEIAIATLTVGTSRIVAFNTFPDDFTSGTNVNRRNIFTNCILWCVGYI